MSQHHYLIKYDSETKEWEWDIETEMAVLPESIYLPQEDIWVKPNINKRVETLDNDICERVSYGLHYLNERKEK